MGVATAYSTAMVLKVIPVSAWALRGTGVRLGEIAAGLSRPLAASAVAAVFALAMHPVYGSVQLSQLRLLLELSLFFALYAPTIFLIARARGNVSGAASHREGDLASIGRRVRVEPRG